MQPIKPASWTYAESFVAEDEILAAARSRAEEVGVAPVGPGVGAALRFLASVLDAARGAGARLGAHRPLLAPRRPEPEPG